MLRTSEEIKEYRRIKGWTQRQMAKELRINRRTIQRYESGLFSLKRQQYLNNAIISYYMRKKTLLYRIRRYAPLLLAHIFSFAYRHQDCEE